VQEKFSLENNDWQLVLDVDGALVEDDVLEAVATEGHVIMVLSGSQSWTQQDSVPHNATGVRALLNLGYTLHNKAHSYYIVCSTVFFIYTAFPAKPKTG